jgi:hypothetical protein
MARVLTRDNGVASNPLKLFEFHKRLMLQAAGTIRIVASL